MGRVTVVYNDSASAHLNLPHPSSCCSLCSTGHCIFVEPVCCPILASYKCVLCKVGLDSLPLNQCATYAAGRDPTMQWPPTPNHANAVDNGMAVSRDERSL